MVKRLNNMEIIDMQTGKRKNGYEKWVFDDPVYTATEMVMVWATKESPWFMIKEVVTIISIMTLADPKIVLKNVEEKLRNQ